jgi:hypothetical protein
MFSSGASSASLLARFRRGLRPWMCALAGLVLGVWQLGFSTHLHLPDEHGHEHDAQIQHDCSFCAAFQAGAGPAWFEFAPPPVAHIETDVQVSLPPVLSPPAAVYRSRAPPRA